MIDILSTLWMLIVDISYSWTRMLIALLFSVLFGLGIGILAARSRRAELIILPLLDIFQTLPILAFFPFAIFVILLVLPSYIGVNAAVIFLIFTSMAWNIAFGVYEAVKTLPVELTDISRLYKLSLFERLKKILVPASMPRVVTQARLSWAIGLFYLVTSEIFSTGNANYAVKNGIGVALTALAFSGNYAAYFLGIIVFILFVIATYLLLFNTWDKIVNRYNTETVNNQPQYGYSLSRIRLPFVRTIIKKIRLPRMRVRAHVMKKLVHHGIKINTGYVIAIVIMALLMILYLTGALNSANLSDEGTVLAALTYSFVRVWGSLIIILLIAVPVSVHLIFNTKRPAPYMTAFQVIASIPATILLPIIVIALRPIPSSGELIAIMIFVLSGVWYLIFSIIASSRNIPSNVFEVVKLFKLRGVSAWRNVYLGAITPGLITGCVTGLAAEWNAAIVAEMFTTNAISGGTVVTSVGTGIGKLLDLALNSGNLVLMVIGLINLTVMILLVNTFIWKRLYSKVAKTYA